MRRRRRSSFYAGGAYVDGSGNLTDTSFVGNRADLYGGGIYIRGAADINGSSFEGNGAQFGGGMYVQATANITGADIVNNSGNYGGGVAVFGTAHITGTTFERNTFVNNRAPNNRGDAVYMSSTGGSNDLLTMLHTTIASVPAQDSAAINVNSGTLFITNTIVSNQARAIVQNVATVSEDYNLFDNVTTLYVGPVNSGSHSISGDAAFVDAANGNYQLSAASEAINAGTNVGITSDFFGDVRPQQGGFDIGFDESSFAPSAPNVAMVKNAQSNAAAPGAPVTYTLNFSNQGPGVARNVVIHDSVAVSVTGVGNYTVTVRASDGRRITPVSFDWSVQPAEYQSYVPMIAK